MGHELLYHVEPKLFFCLKVTHREAAVLLECELEDLNQRMFTLAKQIKEKIYMHPVFPVVVFVVPCISLV